MKAFDFSRPTISAHAVGNARGALEEAVAYSADRSAFGKPIFKHQAVSLCWQIWRQRLMRLDS